VQSLSNDGRASELEPEANDDEYVTAEEGQEVAGHGSTDCSSAESSWNPDWERSQETAGRSEEVYTSARQPGAAPTAEVGEEALASSSSEAVLPGAYGSDSSSNRGPDKCPVCFVALAGQDVGTPDTCDHIFCAGCLEEWSNNANTCPLDRQVFNVILVRNSPEGEIIRRIPVTPPMQQNLFEIWILPDILLCTLCGGSDGEDRMLICGRCGHIYHAECLDPHMGTVPLELFCPVCFLLSVFEVY
jgi:PHD and RING finger domain-containing protein 1